MNDEVKEILQILQEECAEVIVEICKIMRFGPDQCKPNSDETNIQALQKELGDLEAMIELLVKAKVGINKNNIDLAKKKKYEKLRIYSRINLHKYKK
jgi:hypothetical protein